MGCNCANKNKLNQPNTVVNSTPQTVDQVYQLLEQQDKDEFIDVIYQGPEYLHYIGSPTGIITKYNLRNYGLARKGNVVKIHIDDFNKSPWLFTKVETKLKEDLVELEEVITEVVENHPETVVSDTEVSSSDEDQIKVLVKKKVKK